MGSKTVFVCVCILQIISVKGTAHIFDLSHTYHEGMPFRDGGVPLEVSLMRQDEGDGVRAKFYDFFLSEKSGTHINAPSTYEHTNGSLTVDRLPLKLLVNVPGVVIDLPVDRGNRGTNADRSRVLTTGHLTQWEEEHGRIPHGALVILRTGWSSYFSHPDKFFGYFADEDGQVFPGFSPSAASWLLDQRAVVGLATECTDIELARGGPVKKLLAQKQRYSILQLTHVDRLPPKGITVTVAPLKLQNGSGGPARVFAAVNKHVRHHQQHKQQQQQRDWSEQERKDMCQEFLQQPQSYSSSSTANHLHYYCVTICVAFMLMSI